MGDDGRGRGQLADFHSDDLFVNLRGRNRKIWPLDRLGGLYDRFRNTVFLKISAWKLEKNQNIDILGELSPFLSFKDSTV